MLHQSNPSIRCIDSQFPIDLKHKIKQSSQYLVIKYCLGIEVLICVAMRVTIDNINSSALSKKIWSVYNDHRINPNLAVTCNDISYILGQFKTEAEALECFNQNINLKKNPNLTVD